MHNTLKFCFITDDKERPMFVIVFFNGNIFHIEYNTQNIIQYSLQIPIMTPGSYIYIYEFQVLNNHQFSFYK